MSQRKIAAGKLLQVLHVIEGWYIVCQSKDLSAKPKACSLFERHFVVFRTKNGQPAALEDRCAHRNARLSDGCVKAGNIECPYHGWRYRADGSVAEIPAACDSSEKTKNIAIRTFPCLELDGFVWVSPSELPMRDEPYRFPFYGAPGWTTFVLQTDFNAPVEACLENFLDCPHATHVHKGWFRTPMKETVHAVVRTLDDGAVAEYFNEPRKRSVVWKFLSRTKSDMRHTDRFIAPATSRVDYIFSDHRHYTITSSCTPLSAERTRVYTVITFKFGNIGKLIRLFFRPLSRLIIKQDVAMLNKQYDNIRRFGRPQFHYVPADLLGPHIVRWREALDQNKRPPRAGIEQHVDIRL